MYSLSVQSGSVFGELTDSKLSWENHTENLFFCKKWQIMKYGFSTASETNNGYDFSVACET